MHSVHSSEHVHSTASALQLNNEKVCYITCTRNSNSIMGSGLSFCSLITEMPERHDKRNNYLPKGNDRRLQKNN